MERTIQNKISFIEELLMFFFMCISGNPAFTSLGDFFKLSSVFFVILIFVAFGNNIENKKKKDMLKWGRFLVVIFIAQYITLHDLTLLGSINFVSKLYAAILIASLLREKISEVYFRVMYIICLISLFFYVQNLMGIYYPALEINKESANSLIIFTQYFEGDYVTGLVRNSGMFWEPGAFAGYIIVAFMLNIRNLDEVWRKHKQKCLILIIALLTTMSTTGYVAFSIVIVYFTKKIIRSRLVFFWAFFILFGAFFYLYVNSDFLGSKIESQYQEALTQDDTDNNFSRFGTIVFDWQYIIEHPLFGNGLMAETRYAKHLAYYDYDDLQAFGNGLTGIIASMGILFFFTFLTAMYRNPTLPYKGQKIMLLLLFLLLLNGEQFMNYPLFMIFPFVNYNKLMPLDFQHK